jgi:NTP pyrophosphatase (non-canonical NTP hydrolase)
MLSVKMIDLPKQIDINDMLDKVYFEIHNANIAYPQFTSAHEAYAVLLEEVEEVWEHVRKKPQARNMEELDGELIQVAAMAVKFIWWCRENRKGKE